MSIKIASIMCRKTSPWTLFHKFLSPIFGYAVKHENAQSVRAYNNDYYISFYAFLRNYAISELISGTFVVRKNFSVNSKWCSLWWKSLFLFCSGCLRSFLANIFVVFANLLLTEHCKVSAKLSFLRIPIKKLSVYRNPIQTFLRFYPRHPVD